MLRHRSETATFVAENSPRWFAIIVTVIFGVYALFPLVVNKYLLVEPPLWAKHLPLPIVAAWSLIVAIAMIWGCSRGWCMGLNIDDEGVRVRNYFRTYRISWPEVNCLVDGSVWGQGLWALSVLNHRGGAFTASGTARSQARPEVLDAIELAAGQHGILAELTGKPGMWLGPKWRSYLPSIIVLILFILFFAVLVSAGAASCPKSGCSPVTGG